MARKQGRIEVICGPMFCGKTEELLRRVRRAVIARQNVQVFKHSLEDRYDESQVVAHHGQSSALADSAENARELSGRLRFPVEVVAIDEVQFFDTAVVEVIEYIARQGGRVIVSGLDQDYRGHPFGHMPLLMALADQVDKLQAVCNRCGAPATRSQRLIGGKPARADDPLILMGGMEAYEARCRRCHRVRGMKVRTPPGL